VLSLSRKLKLNLNSRLVVIFVLRLAKPLSKNTKRNRSAKVKVTQCLQNIVSQSQSSTFDQNPNLQRGLSAIAELLDCYLSVWLGTQCQRLPGQHECIARRCGISVEQQICITRLFLIIRLILVSTRYTADDIGVAKAARAICTLGREISLPSSLITICSFLFYSCSSPFSYLVHSVV